MRRFKTLLHLQVSPTFVHFLKPAMKGVTPHDGILYTTSRTVYAVPSISSLVNAASHHILEDEEIDDFISQGLVKKFKISAEILGIAVDPEDEVWWTLTRTDLLSYGLEGLKSRVTLTNQSGGPSGLWFVEHGLLVVGYNSNYTLDFYNASDLKFLASFTLDAGKPASTSCFNVISTYANTILVASQSRSSIIALETRQSRSANVLAGYREWAQKSSLCSIYPTEKPGVESSDILLASISDERIQMFDDLTIGGGQIEAFVATAPVILATTPALAPAPESKGVAQIATVPLSQSELKASKKPIEEPKAIPSTPPPPPVPTHHASHSKDPRTIPAPTAGPDEDPALLNLLLKAEEYLNKMEDELEMRQKSDKTSTFGLENGSGMIDLDAFVVEKVSGTSSESGPTSLIAPTASTPAVAPTVPPAAAVVDVAPSTSASHVVVKVLNGPRPETKKSATENLVAKEDKTDLLSKDSNKAATATVTTAVVANAAAVATAKKEKSRGKDKESSKKMKENSNPEISAPKTILQRPKTEENKPSITSSPIPPAPVVVVAAAPVSKTPAPSSAPAVTAKKPVTTPLPANGTSPSPPPGSAAASILNSVSSGQTMSNQQWSTYTRELKRTEDSIMTKCSKMMRGEMDRMCELFLFFYLKIS